MRRRDAEHAQVKRQFRLQGAHHAVGLAEAVALSLERDVGDRHAALAQRLHHRFRLLGRHHLVVEALEEDHRALQRIGMVDRRACAVDLVRLGFRGDQVFVVVRLELVRVGVESRQVGHAVIAGAGFEHVVEGEGGQGRQAAGAAAADQQALGVGQAAVGQVACAGHAILDVDDAPLAFQQVAVGASEAGAAAVVHVEHGEAAAGPELGRQFQGAGCHPGRAAVADHDQRRQFARQCFEVFVGRCVMEGVGGAPVRAAVADAARDRQVGHLGQVRARLHQDTALARVRIDQRQFQRHRRRTGQHGHRLGRDAQFADFLVRRLDRRERAAARRQARQAADAVLDIGADDFVVRPETVHRAAEAPVRAAELRLARAQRMHHAVLEAVQIPPAAAVGHEVQQAAGRPLGLADRLVQAAGDQAAVDQAAVLRDVGHPQFRALPGHARMVPAQPGQLAPVRGQARRRIKIVAVDEDGFTAIEAHRADRVDRIGFAGQVVFAHRDQAIPRTVGHEVGVAHGFFSRDHDGLAARLDPVQVVVGEMREPDRALVHRIRAAAVLVHAGADVKRDRREFGGGIGAIAGAPALQGHAARFAGAAGQPQHICTVERDVRQRRGAGRHHGGADRGSPGAAGSGLFAGRLGHGVGIIERGKPHYKSADRQAESRQACAMRAPGCAAGSGRASTDRLACFTRKNC